MNFLLVGLGGSLGSIIRYSLSLLIPHATLTVNLFGSLIIGFLLGMGREKLGNEWGLFLVPGFLGGFTTFSAFSSESITMLKNGFYGNLFLYLAVSVAGGVILGMAGFYMGKLLLPSP